MKTTQLENIVLLMVFLAFIVYVSLPSHYKSIKKPSKPIATTPLTIEKVRTYKGLEQLTDEQAQNVIYTIRKFTELTFGLYQTEKTNPKTI